TPARNRRSSIRPAASSVPSSSFVAVLGASNYTHAAAAEAPQRADFLPKQSRAPEDVYAGPPLIMHDYVSGHIVCHLHPGVTSESFGFAWLRFFPERSG